MKSESKGDQELPDEEIARRMEYNIRQFLSTRPQRRGKNPKSSSPSRKPKNPPASKEPGGS